MSCIQPARAGRRPVRFLRSLDGDELNIDVVRLRPAVPPGGGERYVGGSREPGAPP